MRALRRPGLVSLAVAACLALILAAGADSPGQARAQFAGRVAGVVVNGTSGASVPEDLEVLLLTIDLDGNPLDQKSTRVDSRGYFEFTNVLSGDTVLNRLVTDHGGVVTTLRLEDEIAPANLKVTIFETTRSLDSISVVNEVIVVRPDGPSRLMGFLELVTLQNGGDRTFVADLTDPALTGLDMVRFGLPQGYEGFGGVSIDPPLPFGRILESGPGFALTNPIPPGQYQIFFDYFVRYDGSTFQFARNMPFGAGEVRVLLPAESGYVEGSGMARVEDVTLGTSVYSVTSGTGFERDARVELAFTQLPEPSRWQSVRTRLQEADTYVKVGVPVAAGAVLAGLLAYVFLRRRREAEDAALGPDEFENGSEDVPSLGQPAEPDPERDALVREIALLDERFEAGEVEEEDYRRRRADLTAKALEARGGN